MQNFVLKHKKCLKKLQNILLNFKLEISYVKFQPVTSSLLSITYTNIAISYSIFFNLITYCVRLNFINQT